MIDERLEQYLRVNGGVLAWKAGADDDALQEGRIAAWQALRKRPDATNSYLDQAASWRINAVHRGESLTGETRPGGGRVDALRTPLAPEEAGYSIPSRNDAEGRELAYHAGEIHEAVAELPEAHRLYVVGRFWADMDRNEIAELTQRNAGNLATTWRTQIRPALAAKLAHLEDAA